MMELKIDGRIDAQWSDHFSHEIEDVIRNGHHDIQLDMKDVSFMSSAGIRVLMKCYKQLNEISGSLTIANPSDTVKNILEMSGLMAMFDKKAETADSACAETTSIKKGSYCANKSIKGGVLIYLLPAAPPCPTYPSPPLAPAEALLKSVIERII